MTVLIFVSLLAALIIFVIAAFNVAITRVNLIALGLALMALAFVLERWPK